MKKLIVFAAVALVVGSCFAAFSTLDTQDATKTGLDSLATKINANFALLPATILTNVTAQTATVTGTVTPQTGTVTVTLAPQTSPMFDSTGAAITNAGGFAVLAITNMTASFTGLTNVTVNVAGVTTNVLNARKNP